MLPRPQGGCSLLRPCEGNREPGDLALPGASPHLMLDGTRGPTDQV